MNQPFAEEMLELAARTKEDRVKRERETTERSYPYAKAKILELAKNEVKEIRLETIMNVMHGKCNEHLLIKMLEADKFHIYTDKTEFTIGVQMVTWDPELANWHKEEAEKNARDSFSP